MTGILMAFSFMAGFALGCFAYSMTYAVFRHMMESQAKVRLAAYEAKVLANRAKVESIKDRLKDTYGSDLSKRHEVIVDEEIEKILGTASTKDR
jgi:hypothetical protein